MDTQRPAHTDDDRRVTPMYVAVVVVEAVVVFALWALGRYFAS